MAITMTRVGNLPAEKWYTGRCNTCKSEYRAQQKDLTYECDSESPFTLPSASWKVATKQFILWWTGD